MATVTIPREIAKSGDLVVIPRKEFEQLVARAAEAVGEQEVRRWSKDARRLRRAGKLPVLRSLRTL